MDEEQHHEAFNMDNDFEGLVEVGGEFMFRSVYTRLGQHSWAQAMA